MRHLAADGQLTFMLLTIISMMTLLAPAMGQELALRHTADRGRIDVVVDGHVVGTYVYRDAEFTRPMWVNIKTPRGIAVTRPFPPTDPTDQDHPQLHSSLWLAFGDINGQDYWRLKARVEHREFLQLPQVDGGSGSFTTRSDYLSADGKEVIAREDARFTITPRSDGLLIAAQHRISSKQQLRFGNQEEMGVGVRIASPLRVKGGSGKIINAQGSLNESQVWGHETEWLDYHGPLEGRRAGVLLMMNPDNPRAAWAHCRDYGVMVLNPIPRSGSADQRVAPLQLAAGEPMEIGYGALFYDVPLDEPFSPSQVFVQYQALRPEPSLP